MSAYRLVAALLALALPSSGAAPLRGVAAQEGPSSEAAAGRPTAAARGAPMVLGVQTHFSQGWSPALVDRVRTSGAMSVRDSVPWPRGEPTPGRYALDTAAPAALDAICRSGASLLLTIVPQHPAYDDGLTVNSASGIAAFARYAGALADRYRTCLAGIEVGNEINDPRNLPYPAGVQAPAAYVSLVAATRREVRRRGSAAAVVGGSTNVIGTGFLDILFAAGLLEAADAIAVHPYRAQAEAVDGEIANLVRVMRRHGRVLPIWATEFSDNHATPEIAAEELVKMVTLLSAAGVARGYWYALIDQRWFRNMGLYTTSGDEKPAARAFVQAAVLTGAGRASLVDLGDPGIRLYRFADDAYVLWGGGGRAAFAGTPAIRDAYGRTVAQAAAGTVPLLVTGAGAPSLAAPSGIVADSLFDFGQRPWSYLAQTSDGDFHPLALSDGQWDSAYTSRFYQPLRIGSATAAVAGTGGSPTRAIIRYTSPTARRLHVTACFAKQDKGDGVDIAVLAAGRTLWRGVLTTQTQIGPISVDLPRGGILDVRIGPNQTAGGDAFAYRVRLFEREAGRAVACPHRPVPVG